MSHLFSNTASSRQRNKPVPDDQDNDKINQDLQSYLEQHYISAPSSKKKKKRKKERNSSLRIVDKDVSGFHAMEEAPAMEGLDPEGPIVVNEVDAAVAERFQEKQRNKKYYGEGGWTTIRQESPAPDLSPPRKHHTEPLAPDLSPQRKHRTESLAPDLSPPRKLHTEPPAPDLSPQRTHREEPAAPDLSPPRDRGVDKKRRMMDGSRTGVVTAEQMREEMRKKRKEDKDRIYGMGDDVTGRGAQTIYRNKQGERVSLEELKKAEEQEVRIHCF